MIMTAAQHIEMAMAKDGKPIFGPIYPANIFDLMNWCDDYRKNDRFPVEINIRFIIALYQIHQGMGWKDNGVNKYESYAAAVIHLFLVASLMSVPLEKYMPVEFKEIEYEGMTDAGCKRLLFSLSALSQQLYYTITRTKRKSRCNQERLENHLVICIFSLFRWIPADLRGECFYAASSIMTKELK